MHNSLCGVPVAELVLRHLVGIDIDGILQPLVTKNLRGDGRLARTVWPGNDDEDGLMTLGYHVAVIFAASCFNCSK